MTLFRPKPFQTPPQILKPEKENKPFIVGASLRGKQDNVKSAIKKGYLPQKYLISFTDTYPGLRNAVCEDRACVNLEKGMLAVFDGVGGRGDAVAELAKQSCKKMFNDIETVSTITTVRHKIEEYLISLNEEIKRRKDTDKIPQKCDSTAAILVPFTDQRSGKNMIALASIGDSLIFRFNLRTNSLERLTRPDTVMTTPEMGKKGEEIFDAISELTEVPHYTNLLTPYFYKRNVLTASCGSLQESDLADISNRVLVMDECPDSIYLVLSDGISDNLTPSEMTDIIIKNRNNLNDIVFGMQDKACEKMVDLSTKSKGKLDDSTVLAYRRPLPKQQIKTAH